MADTLTHAVRPHDRAIATGAVRIEEVSKSFRVNGRDLQALRDVSLAIRAGEFFSIVGPSGCGKSTLLRFLAGLDRPDTGKVVVDNDEVTGPSLRRGIVFQDHRLLPWLSVAQNIGLALKALPGPEPEKQARVEELIALVGLRGFADALPHQLSGGMSQRAAIARGLAPRPPLLLLDEPLGALDSLNRARLQDELLAIREKERSTVVLITHDVEEAVYLSDRVAVMAPRPGRITTTIAIPQPRPRERSAPELSELRHHITRLIREKDTDL